MNDCPVFEVGQVYTSWMNDRRWQVIDREGDEVTVLDLFYRSTVTATAEVVRINQYGELSERIMLPGPSRDRIYSNDRMN